MAGVTVDDADVGRIQRRVQSHLREVQQQDETARWKDQGYWLTFPVALLGLLWFRRGWTVRWSCRPARAGLGRRAAGFADLWWTADQQGRRHFERGDYGAAAERFEDPMWKGAAHYRAATTSRRRTRSPRRHGRGLVQPGQRLRHARALRGGRAGYDAALADRPEWPRRSRTASVVACSRSSRCRRRSRRAGEPSFDPDEIQFDEKGREGPQGEVEMSQLTDEQLAEMWLRRLQTSPADFLRQRFAMEAAARRKATDDEPVRRPLHALGLGSARPLSRRTRAPRPFARTRLEPRPR